MICVGEENIYYPRDVILITNNIIMICIVSIDILTLNVFSRWVKTQPKNINVNKNE